MKIILHIVPKNSITTIGIGPHGPWFNFYGKKKAVEWEWKARLRIYEVSDDTELPF